MSITGKCYLPSKISVIWAHTELGHLDIGGITVISDCIENCSKFCFTHGLLLQKKFIYHPNGQMSSFYLGHVIRIIGPTYFACIHVQFGLHSERCRNKRNVVLMLRHGLCACTHKRLSVMILKFVPRDKAPANFFLGLVGY